MISPINTQPGHYEGVYGLDKSPAPVPGGYTNWKDIATTTGIALGVTVIGIWIFKRQMDKHNEQWMKQIKEANKRHAEAQDMYNGLLGTLVSEFKLQRKEMAMLAQPDIISNDSETIKSNNHEG